MESRLRGAARALVEAQNRNGMVLLQPHGAESMAAAPVSLWQALCKAVSAPEEPDAMLAKAYERINSLHEESRRLRELVAERDALLEDLTDAVKSYGLQGVMDALLARYAKMSPPGATRHDGRPESDSGKTAGGASGGPCNSESSGATESEGPEAESLKRAENPVPPSGVTGGASGSPLCVCGHPWVIHDSKGYCCARGCIPPGPCNHPPVGNRDEGAVKPTEHPAMPTGSLFSRVMETLRWADAHLSKPTGARGPEWENCQICAVLRDLDEWAAKARAADLSLSAPGLNNAHYLLTEFLGDRP